MTDLHFPRFLLLLASVVLAAAPGHGIDCEELSSDGETTVSVRIEEPAPGSQIRGWVPDCDGSQLVSGFASTVGVPPLFDVYLIIDRSGSTGACSGVDVDEDGFTGIDYGQNQCSDPDDTILEAEIEAARRFVDSLSADASRVAVIDFSDRQFGVVVTRQPLTSEFSRVHTALTQMSRSGPNGATDYGAALDEMNMEHDRRSEPDRTQVGLFLSDGIPTAPTPPYTSTNGDDEPNALAAADRAALRDITVHTFAVGASASNAVLRKISERTGGDHFDIETPGEILDVLPGTSLVGIQEVIVTNLTTGEEIVLEPSPDGHYETSVTLVEGLNEIQVVAVASDDEGTTVTCYTDVVLACMTFDCPEDVVASCEGPGGTWVGGLEGIASDPAVEISNDSAYDETPAIGDADASGTYPLGDTNIGFLFEDEDAGDRTCSTLVSIVDDVAPELACPSPSVEPADEECKAILDLEASAEDVCAGPNGVIVTDDGPADDVYDLGTTLVTFTAEDDAGNASTCDTTVTVDDVTPPEIECPDDSVEEEGIDSCEAELDLDADASDNCEDQTGLEVTDDGPADGIFGLGTHVVTFTAEDGAGQSASCSTTIEVLDIGPPDITCPADTVLETGEGNESCEVPFDPEAEAEDLCDPDVELTDDAPDLFSLGDTLVTHTAQDDAGNTASCDHLVTVVDTTVPVLDCPEDITLETEPEDEDCQVPYDPEATALDNCDGDLDVEDDAPDTFPVGTTTVTFTTSDTAGNEASCTQDVTVLDATPPDLDCPDDIVLETGPDDDDCLVPYEPAALAEDNCDADVEITDDAPDLFPLGTTTVTFTAVDDAGNTASCTQTVTVEDTTPPVLECPADQDLETGPDDDDCLVPYEPIVEAQDNCSGQVDVTDDGLGEYGLGTHVITYTATDDAGNVSTCSQVITVEDTTPPVIECPADVLLETGPDDTDCMVPLEIEAEAVDNCDPEVDVTDDAPNLYPLGATVVSFQAVDDSGNTASCSTTVTVIDTTPPEILFPNGDEACLWPPDHRFYCFDAEDWCDVWDNCDADIALELACLPEGGSNQPIDGTGDGAFAPDCVTALDGVSGFCVRSERKGDAADQGPRLYEIGVSAEDDSGNTAEESLEIRVDHDRRAHPECLPAHPSTSYGPEDRYLPEEYPQFRLPGSPGQRRQEGGDAGGGGEAHGQGKGRGGGS